MNNIIKLEDINDELAKGYYGDIECIFMKSNNYINISKLCKYGTTKGDNPKEFTKWLESKSSKEIIKEINKFITNKTCLICIKNVSINYRGYYVHKLLAIHVAQWISINFSLRVSNMYDYYATKKYEIEMNNKDIKLINVNLISEEQLDITKKIDINQSKIIEKNKILKSCSVKKTNKHLINTIVLNKCINEKEWYYLLNQYNSNIILQYSVNNYKIDAYYEDDEKNTYFLEYDENDHKGYDTINELNRYKNILKTFIFYSRNINILRFSDSYKYSLLDIKTIIEYTNNLSTKYNIIYINYNKHRIIKVNEILYSFTIYEYLNTS